MRNEKGLTFVELMIVISIIGIMAGMAIPLMSGSRVKLKAAARDIVSELQVARLNAMKDGRLAQWRLTFDATKNTYAISERTAGANTPDVATDDIFTPRKTVRLSDTGKNLVFGTCTLCGQVPTSASSGDSGIPFPGNTVTFRSDGALTPQSSGSIYIMDKKTNDTIAVSVLFMTGRVHTRTNFGNGKGWSK